MYLLAGECKWVFSYSLFARLRILHGAQTHPVRTITADNGTEMTGYLALEAALRTRFYFTQPYGAWKRGSIKHLNDLIRRAYPKGTYFTPGTQRDCTRLARRLNSRPRHRFGVQSPEECYVP